MKKTILNKKVRQLYQRYESNYNNKSLNGDKRIEAYQIMQIISSVANVYEKDADVFFGHLIIFDHEWIAPEKVDELVKLICESY